MKRVIIKGLPKKALGGNYQTISSDGVAAMKPDTAVNNSLQPVSREEANVEAEKGETVLTNLNGTALPEHYNIGGKRHSEGGTPLNLPSNSFVFSDTAKMKIKDPVILQMFNKSGKKGVTPAAIAKQFDINKYQKILKDPYSDKISRDTAELMIKNYNEKLGELALIQESQKGFKEGIPSISIPLLESMGINPASFVPEIDESQMVPEMKFGGQLRKYAEGDEVQGEDPIVKYNGKYANLKPWNELSEKEKSRYNNKIEVYNKFLTDAKLLLNDPKLIQDIKNNTDKIASKSEFYTGKEKGKKGYEKAIKEMSIDDVIDNLLTLEENNSRLRAFGYSPSKEAGQASIKGRNINKGMAEVIDANPELQDMDFSRTFKSQAAYLGYVESLKNSDKYQYSPSKQAIGEKDELPQYAGSITGIDQDWTNTTSGQFLNLSSYLRPEAKPLEQVEDNKIELTKGEDPEYIDREDMGTPWWLQDQINFSGALLDKARIKKYTPWQGTANVNLADPTFYDPTRELAANAEQAAIASNAVSTFAGPQSTNARLSGIQGQAAAQAANIMASYNKANVDTANSFEQFNTQLQNQDSANRANLATQLYDKQTILNQQFDNSKNMAREMIRRQFVNGITNANKTATLNEMYDQYYTDPTTGGRVYKKPGSDKKLNPSAYQDELLQKAKYLQAMFQLAPDIDKAEASAAVFGVGSKGAKPSKDDFADYLKYMPNFLNQEE